jgi:aspartyl-tRNA(Asn)/glutamyl-tRNA(Gln) amidotransferase subunit B
MSVFERKNYFYPDLPKGYQISQYALPIVRGGALIVQLDEEELTVALTRAHLEEDAGKSVHDAFFARTGVDLNRAGVPLLEIVSEPCLHSPEHAVAYLRTLHTLVQAIDICDGNMQEGSFRCDANVSVHRVGTPFGTRVEIKNINSFRFVEKAIRYEIDRQIRALEAGENIVQETRLYDAARHETRSMRSKENADDYRYFPDPDLPPLRIEQAWIESIASSMPELPRARRNRYISALGLSPYEANLLALDAAFAHFFEAIIQGPALGPQHAKLAANWLLGDVSAALNQRECSLSELALQPARLAQLIARVIDGTLSHKLAKNVFDALLQADADVDALIDQLGLRQISDASALASIVDAVIAEHPKQVQQYFDGQDKVLQFLMGQAMKASRGQGNPVELTNLLRARLQIPK